MKRYFIMLSIAIGLAACAKVPITGRKQMKLLPATTLNAMALQQYNEFISTHTLCADGNKVALVQRVGKRIENALTNYFKIKGQLKLLAGYKWVFNVVEENTVNAWCMPGGKVVVYTGLLPITQNEDALAVVMGHEIAHAIANHGNERMSEGLALQAGGMALSVALSNKSPETQNLFLKAYGIGANVGAVLPFSRMHESEADEMGLIFMAMAGYNPEEAIPFWRRMEDASKGAPPGFLSTHPSDHNRIEHLKKVLPTAKAYATKYPLPK